MNRTRSIRTVHERWPSNAVIPGDGIGKVVASEGMRVLEAAGRRFGFDLEWSMFDWTCEACERRQSHRMHTENACPPVFAVRVLRGVGERRRAHRGRHPLLPADDL